MIFRFKGLREEVKELENFAKKVGKMAILIYKIYSILCFSVSIIIEFLQYISMYFGNRCFVDIDDVILNTLGALIGFAIFKLINSKVLKNV